MDPISSAIIGSLISAGISSGLPWLMNQFGGSGQGQGQQGGINPYDTGTQSPFAEWFIGNPERVAHIPLYTEQQSPLFQLLGQQGQQQLMNPYTGFEDIAKNAQQQFQSQTVPSLAERFTSLGYGLDKMGSPAFTQAALSAGANMQSQLAGMKQLYGMQNRNQALQMLDTALTPQYQNLSFAAQPGLAQGLMPELMHVGGQLLGKFGEKKIENYFNPPVPAKG